MPATIKFLNPQLRGAHKVKAKELYISIMAVVEKRVDAIDKLASFQSTKAFGYYLQLKTIVRYDRAFIGNFDKRFKTLFANRKILELHRLINRVNDTILKEKSRAQTKSKLTFARRNYKHREICMEAQLAIEKIDKLLGM